MFISCDKDDDGPEPNYVTIGTTTYDLTYAEMSYWDQTEQLQGFDLWLYEDYDLGSEATEVNIYTLCCESAAGHLKSGTYVPGDLKHSEGSDYWDYQAEEWIEWGENTNIRVKNHGNDIYEFWWDSTAENGLRVKGHYKGHVDVEDRRLGSICRHILREKPMASPAF